MSNQQTPTAPGTAERLLQASAVLRERAAAATAGPWVANVLGSEGYDIRADNPASRFRRIRVARFGNEEWETDKANATYVATVDPTVGLATADWLDLMATEYAPYWSEPYAAPFVPVIERAYHVADAILGSS